MSNIRKGKDLTLNISVTTNKENTPLDGRSLMLEIKSPLGTIYRPSVQVRGDLLVAVYPGKKQHFCGPYRVTLWENKGTEGQTAVDWCEAFCLVETTCEEGGVDPEGLDVEVVNLTGDIAVGIQGPSAYQIAVDNGFVGTEQEWLESLHGKPFTYKDFTKRSWQS